MRSCLACGCRLLYFGTSSGLDIYRCSCCGLGVTAGTGMVSYHDYERDQVYREQEGQFRNIFSKRVEVISRLKKPGRVLEIGSSTGLLLSLLKDKGWKVQGVEPSKGAYKEAVRRSVPTKNTTFEKSTFKPASFDLVIFNHVLEHMGSPLGVLGRVNEVLKKDGVVFIDVPNFGSLSARIWGRKWKYLLPKEHKWHFTKDSLTRLLKKAGFEVVHWEARSGIWDYGNPWVEVQDSFLGMKKRFFADVLTFVPTYVITKLKLGTSLTVVGRKVTSTRD